MPSETDIQALVARAQARDQEAVAELFREFSDRIYRFLRFRLSDDQTAEDLTQTVFLEMLQALGRYRAQTTAKFSTWLFQIARFRLIDHYRKRRPEIALDDLAPKHQAALAVDPPLPEPDVVDRVFHRLPERYQTVLHLRFREDLSTQEIARIMKTTSLNVRVLQHRALRALRGLLST